MKYIKITLLLIPLFVLSACSEKKEEASFMTVNYYENNPHIRDKRISECKKMIEMTKTIEEDCRNAYLARPLKLIDTSAW